MNLERTTALLTTFGTVPTASGSRTGYALNDAFVKGTSGPCIGIRYMAQSAQAINKLYVFADAFADLANVTMECTIYDEHATAQSRPGGNLRATSNAVTLPDGDDKWVEVDFAGGTPYTPSVGEILWFLIYNTSAAPTTDYPSIMTGTISLFSAVPGGIGIVHAYTNAAGFSTNGSVVSEMPFVVVQGTIPIAGQPFTTYLTAHYSSNTLERGMLITPLEDVLIAGAHWVGGVTQFATLRITKSTTAPGAAVGSGEWEYDLDSDTNETTNDICGGKIFDTPITLVGGQTYHVTFTFAANSTYPSAFLTEDYASFSTMFDALRDSNTLAVPYSVIDNGAGGWTTDKSICPGIALIVSSFPAIAGGGGGPIMGGMVVR